MEYSIEEKDKIQEHLLNAMNSDNADYILAQLTMIYRYILKNNLGNDIDYNHTIILDNKFIENIINRGDKDINEYLEEV